MNHSMLWFSSNSLLMHTCRPWHWPSATSLVQNSHPHPIVFSQSLLMRLLAPYCAHCWKTVPCPSTTAPSAFSKTIMDVCCASASVVSATFLTISHSSACDVVLVFFPVEFTCLFTLMSNKVNVDWLIDWFSRKRANSKDTGLISGCNQRRQDTRMLPQAALLQEWPLPQLFQMTPAQTW